MSEGCLYLIGTPIGNMEDISFRALDILKKTDVIACEDTREMLKIFTNYNIKSKLVPYNEYNKSRATNSLLNLLLDGKTVGLTCDRGMPGISDAGTFLVQQAIERGIKVVPVPGPTALATALVVSGLPTDSFLFEGFLPKKDSKLRKYLQGLKQEERTLVFYESPYRIRRTLEEMLAIFGDRNIAVCRELTKKFEEVLRMTFSQAIKHFESTEPIGEFTLVVQGAKENEA